jgi:hypothetical protein
LCGYRRWVARIFERVKQRPQFVVTKLLNFDEPTVRVEAPPAEHS